VWCGRVGRKPEVLLNPQKIQTIRTGRASKAFRLLQAGGFVQLFRTPGVNIGACVHFAIVAINKKLSQNIRCGECVTNCSTPTTVFSHNCQLNLTTASVH
jgi:hypothetical protein